MKLNISIIVFFISIIAFAQTQTRDVLYLKNGSVIKGTVTEMNPSTGIKIKTADGSLFVYKMDEILKTEKEEFVGQQINQETSSGVSQEALESHFKNFFKEKRPALRYIGASRINGVKREIYGQKTYEVEYELIVEATQDLFISDMMSINGNGFKKDFSYLTKQPQGWDSYINAGSKKLAKGQRVVANGSLSFEETDNGWRAKGFNNKNYKTVASNYVSPKMKEQLAQDKAQQAIDNAKMIAQLKVDLDWRTEDTQPVEFESNFYSVKDVPFFEYGNSRFSIKPLSTYKGRNDVASKIQNTFNEAVASTNRIVKSDMITYSQSANQANYMFLITRVDFTFKDAGYQCLIKVAGKVKGTYNQPDTYPFDYAIKLESKSNSYKKNMSKAGAFNEAINDFRSAVSAMIYKYEPIQIKFSRIITNKRGKVNKVVFTKPEHFINASKMKFILMKPSDLFVEDGKFKINDKIGDCVFKGEIIGDEVICDVKGRKNKKAIAKYINTKEKLIGISTF
jgi:hypothetical protein